MGIVQDIVGGVMTAVLKLLSQPRLPKLSGEIIINGLQKPVKIIRDEVGVPHIYAEESHDMYFAQGFVHAQDRLWQMEFNRRLIAGRLSEIIGEATIPVDRWLRTLTMRRVAEFEATILSGPALEMLEAYADGVNAFIQNQPLPIEFKLLGFDPEPWIPADTLAWSKMMAWTLSVNWESEILRAQLIARLGEEKAAELELPHLGRWPFVVPPGSDYSHIGDNALERARAARPFTGPSPYDGLGSNNWVLSGSRTKSGMPIFANDMHLSMTIPSIWYENHLVCADHNVTGVMFPGMPGIISGHNGHVAWGFTNGFPDVQDLYMERLKRKEDGSVQAEYNGTWESVQVLHERINVKGGGSVVEEVLITRHGPVINSLAPDFTGEQPLALRWVALEPNTMYEGILEMNRAKNCEQFQNSLRHWVVPVQNVVYADTQGNIGYAYPGTIPLRAKGDGRIPVPGWTDEYEWIGYIPFDALPHLSNPPEGFIASANNTTISDDYPFPIPIEAITGDRAQRIVEMIGELSSPESERKIGIGEIQEMHFNQVSPSARIFATYLSKLSNNDYANSFKSQVLELFKSWDGNLDVNSTAAAVYQVLIRKMFTLMVQPLLEDPGSPEDENQKISLFEPLMGKGPVPALADLSLVGDRWLSWLTLLLEKPNSHWFNLGEGQKRDDILHLALDLATEELTVRFGADINKWEWGKLHTLSYNHIMSSVPALVKFFNRGPYPMGGDHTTIWATSTQMYNLESPNVVGPPYRMIVDLGDLENSWSLLAPGQCGHPASQYYDDQVDAWFEKGYHRMHYSKSEVEANMKHSLNLKPNSTGGTA